MGWTPFHIHTVEQDAMLTRSVKIKTPVGQDFTPGGHPPIVLPCKEIDAAVQHESAFFLVASQIIDMSQIILVLLVDGPDGKFPVDELPLALVNVLGEL